MDDPRSREILAFYPWVVVRVQCDRCQRRGSYRLARLASKFGAEIRLEDLLRRLSADCRHHNEPRYKRGCEARLVDLDWPRPPPDMPPSPVRLKLIQEEVTREEEERQLRRAARRAIRGF